MSFTDVYILSLVLSLMIALIYRFLSNPAELKRLKEEDKLYTERMKKARKDGNKEESDKILTESLKIKQQLMKSQSRSMIVSLLAFIIFVSVVFVPNYGPYIEVQTEEAAIPGFDDARTGTFTFRGESFDVVVYDEGKKTRFDLDRDGDFADESENEMWDLIFDKDGFFWRFAGPHQGGFLQAAKTGVFVYTPDIVTLPFPIPFLGWEFNGFPLVYLATHTNWFWIYVLITIPCIPLFRKLLGME